jgi:hypothetical protein
LAGDGQLAELMSDTGFFDIQVTSVSFAWRYRNELDWVGEKIDHSASFAAMWRGLDDERRRALAARLAEMTDAFAQSDGSLVVPGVALVAVGDA